VRLCLGLDTPLSPAIHADVMVHSGAKRTCGDHRRTLVWPLRDTANQKAARRSQPYIPVNSDAL